VIAAESIQCFNQVVEHRAQKTCIDRLSHEKESIRRFRFNSNLILSDDCEPQTRFSSEFC
jgi:hypothetical protein